MKKVETHDSDLIVFKRGGGWLMLAGLPILLFGLFFLAAAGAHLISLVLDPEVQKLDEMLFEITCFGLVIACIGLGITFGRTGITIDKKKGIVSSWWGVLGAWRRKNYQLDAFRQVYITKEIRHSKNSNRTVYPVWLRGIEVEIKVTEPRRYEKSRVTAERMAQALFVPLIDSTSGVDVVRDPEKLDESIREQRQRMGEVKDFPEPPANMKIDYTVIGKQIEMKIPPLGGMRLLGFVVVIFIVFYTLFYYFIVGKLSFFNDSMLFILIPLTAFIILDITILLILYRIVSKRILVNVSPDELSITEIWRFGRRTKKIPVPELEELVITGAPGKGQGLMKALLGFSFAGKMMARSDRTTLAFGSGLSADELKWMRAVIEKGVSW